MKDTRLRKVLMSADAVGGVWTYAAELARGLSARGIEVELTVLGPPPSDAQLEEIVHLPQVRVVSTGLPLDWTAHAEDDLDRLAGELRARASAAGAGLVHLNAPAHAGLTAWDRPLVAAAHSCVATWWRAVREGDLPGDLSWRAQRTRHGIKMADAVIAPSRSLARQLRATYGEVRHLHVVHNARRCMPYVSAQVRELVLTAGRLWDPGKNVAIIDEAAASFSFPVCAAGPKVGPNGEHRDFRNLVLLGSLTERELEQHYARTAIFVSMSVYEPFGLSALEAAQAGAALVLSDIDTFRELWNGAACFVPPDDARALATVLDHLMGHPEVRKDLARRARERATHFSTARNLAGTLGAYSQALAAYSRRIDRSAA